MARGRDPPTIISTFHRWPNTSQQLSQTRLEADAGDDPIERRRQRRQDTMAPEQEADPQEGFQIEHVGAGDAVGREELLVLAVALREVEQLKPALGEYLLERQVLQHRPGRMVRVLRKKAQELILEPSGRDGAIEVAHRASIVEQEIGPDTILPRQRLSLGEELRIRRQAGV